jgi:tRNA dimethylallyltransferase
MDDALPLLCIVGPTASGKTALALRVAERLGGEIINADSVQIYKHFDIGSGKPSQEELTRVPHHLLSHIEPGAEMDASVFAELALGAIADIRARGRTPILCGGTFLWVKALLFGLAPAPPQDAAIRMAHRAFVDEHGRSALHERLRQVDAASATRLMPNDFVRVSRALEVYELTGKPLSDFFAEHGFRQPRFVPRLLGVRHSNEHLHARIHARVASMLDAGWVAEVQHLSSLGYRDTRPMSSVGYRQVLQALDAGSVVREQLLEAVAQVTRVFARRQRTWLRDLDVHWLSEEEALDFVAPQDWR